MSNLIIPKSYIDSKIAELEEDIESLRKTASKSFFDEDREDARVSIQIFRSAIESYKDILANSTEVKEDKT